MRTILIALFLYLIRSPKSMNRLKSELDSLIDLSVSNLNQLNYLNACIKEVMRLQPPSPSSLQRICPKGGMIIDGRFIPEGTKVRFSNFAIQRDSRYFSDPDLFKPERWLDDQPLSFSSSHDPRAFFPFLIGPGTCVAKNLALVELRMVCLFSFSIYLIFFSLNSMI